MALGFTFLLFSLKVIDHYENPRNVGSLDKSDSNVGTGLVGAPACGDVMKLQVIVQSNINYVTPLASFHVIWQYGQP